MLGLFSHTKEVTAQTEIPYAETIKGVTVPVSDSIYSIVIFYKSPTCHACYEVIGEYLSQFLPKKNYGITYWIDDIKDRSWRRQSSDYLKTLVKIPGKVVFTPTNLSENEETINKSYKLPLNKEKEFYPIIMLINKESAYNTIYYSNDILLGNLSITIKENFDKDFRNFIEGKYENISTSKAKYKRRKIK